MRVRSYFHPESPILFFTSFLPSTPIFGWEIFLHRKTRQAGPCQLKLTRSLLWEFLRFGDGKLATFCFLLGGVNILYPIRGEATVKREVSSGARSTQPDLRAMPLRGLHSNSRSEVRLMGRAPLSGARRGLAGPPARALTEGV